MIKIRNLEEYYGKKLVINDVSLEVKKGEIYVIVGHSGTRKPTLLRYISGLESCQEGSLKALGTEVKGLSQNDPKELRVLRKGVGTIFQDLTLMEKENVFENVVMPLRIHYSQCKIYSRLLDKEYMSEKDLSQRINSSFNVIGLDYKNRAYPRELNGG